VLASQGINTNRKLIGWQSRLFIQVLQTPIILKVRGIECDASCNHTLSHFI